MQEKFMKKALEQAKIALKNGEIPVGAVIVRNDEIISMACNSREQKQNAINHAEILAISRACKKLKSFRLDDCEMYVTLEPCAMCTGAILNSRLRKIYIGCKDDFYGCSGGKINLLNGEFGLKVDVEFDSKNSEYKELLDRFFINVRQKIKVKKMLGKIISFNCQDNQFFYQDDVLGKIFVYNFLPKSKNAGQVVAIIEDLKKNNISFVVSDKLENIFADDIFLKVKDNYKKTTIKIFTKNKEKKIYNT